MKRLNILLFVISGIVFASCTESDVRKAEFKVPGAHNGACVEIIRKTLETTPGVVSGSVEVDLGTRVVSARYESLVTAKKNLEHAVADAGFATEEVPANPESFAGLPAECRPVTGSNETE